MPSAARAGKAYLIAKHFDSLQWQARRLLAWLNPFTAELSTQPPQLGQTGKEHVWEQDTKQPSNAVGSASLRVQKPSGVGWNLADGHKTCDIASGFALVLWYHSKGIRILWADLFFLKKKSIISECQPLIHFMSLMSCHCGLRPAVSCPPDRYDTARHCVSHKKPTRRCKAVYPKQVIPPNGHPINRQSGWDGFFSDWIIVTLGPYPRWLQPAGLQLGDGARLPEMSRETQAALTAGDGLL